MLNRFLSVCIIVILSANYLNADSHSNHLSVTSEMLLDASHTLTLEEVKVHNDWQSVPNSRLGFIDHTVWFHLSITKRTTALDSHVLRYNFSTIQDLTAYEFHNNTLTNTMYFGTQYPPQVYTVDYEFFLTPLDFSDSDTIEFYIKIDHFGSVPTSFSILDDSELLQDVSSTKLFDGLVYGILLVMIVYNMILFLFTRLDYYLYYIALVTFSLLYQSTIRGYTAHYIWPHASYFVGVADTTFALLFIIFGALFILKLLDINSRNYPKIFYLIILEMVTISLLLSSTIFFELTHLNDSLGLYINALVMGPILALFITIILSAYYLATQRHRTAILFSIAWSFFTLAIIVYVLQIWGVFEGVNWSNNLLAIGSVSEVVLLALILADKINALSAEKNELQFSNSELEYKVDERTKELQKQLYTDQLTELKNRFALIKILGQSEYNLLMLIDIDAFSQINDLYGIQVGNKVLTLFAKNVAQLAAEYKLDAYRIGADEFVLLSNDDTSYDLESFEVITKRIHNLLEQKHYTIDEINETVELSLTVAISHGASNLLNKADMAVATARQNSQKIIIFQDAIDKTHQLQKNLYYKKEIRLALLEDRFTCFFQPIVTAKERPQKYELLMRLKQIEKGEIRYISPYEFLSISIKTNQYEALSRHVLEKGIKTVHELDCDLSVNLSYIEIKNPEFKKWFIGILEKYQMFNRIILEILEDEHLENYAVMKDFCTDLQHYGARIAIDDFGSGFSNFTHILELRPEYIKIDGSIIKNIHTDPHSYSLVKAIVSLSKEIGAMTIAEFVHSKEVLDIATELGVDEFQGFYIAEPQPLF